MRRQPYWNILNPLFTTQSQLETLKGPRPMKGTWSVSMQQTDKCKQCKAVSSCEEIYARLNMSSTGHPVQPQGISLGRQRDAYHSIVA